MGFTIAAAAFVIVLGLRFFSEPRLNACLYDVGVDSIGSLFCAALFFGCMTQRGEGAGAFKTLIILTSAAFAVNEAVFYTLSVPERRTICFSLCLLIKLIDLVMIYCFYKYIRATLGFEGRLAKATETVIPVLLAIEALVLLSNIFYPVTFFIDGVGMYQKTAAAAAEDIFLAAASVLTFILIMRSESPRNQKAAALTFILFPLAEYALMKGQFGNAAQYGMIVMSIVVMYCVIFNDKNRKLVSTQTELDTATKIQTSILPAAPLMVGQSHEVDVHGTMEPAKEVGGDFYDFFMIDDDHLAIVIADVSGKGIPAALFMMETKTMIKDYALTRADIPEIFNNVNERLCENNDEGMFATAWIGILDTRTMILQYTNAGHNYPIFHRKGEPCAELESDPQLFLAGLEFTEYSQNQIQLVPGDKLLLYTDGITEAHDLNHECYGVERLKKVMESCKDISAEELLDSIVKDVNEYARGVPQFDDITMLVLSVKA